MKTWLGCLLWVCFFIPVAAVAVTVTSLYQATVPVNSQADDERIQAVRVGFQQLLVKLTGDVNVLGRPDIKEAIARANYYVADVSYALPTPQAATYSLHVRYSQPDINRLLSRADIAFWGEQRPLILVWLAVTDEQNITEIIGNETPGDALAYLKRQGRKYGIPLIYPLMDVTDMAQISVAEVANVSLPALRTAGKRYSPNGYLVGNMTLASDGYHSEWELILEKNHWKWTLSSKTMDGAIAEAMAEASQTLAKHFSAGLNGF